MSAPEAPAVVAGAPAGIPAVEQPPIWPMYRTLVGVGLLCGLLIVSAYAGTKEVIAQNRAEALQAAIFRVLTDAKSSASFDLSPSGTFVPASAAPAPGERVHAGFDAAGQLVGLAIEAQGMGYQDVVKLLYGYDPSGQVIVGFEVLESRETPGLGTRIETDEAFLANFEALDVSLDATGAAPAHPIEAVKPGKKTSAWQIDTISGATISSKAVADILAASSATWAPRIQPRLPDFVAGTAP